MASEKVREQNLALRVMRLSRPRFNERIVLCESDCGHEPIESFLIAPHTMRDVYLGESFSFYISIINMSAYSCKEITIKADVQTLTQRVSIGESSFDGAVLASNQQIGQIFKHQIQELGQHILVCALSYKSVDSEKLNLRKFFKFPVSKPIELIKQNFYEIKGGIIYYEAQIQNLCANPIYIQSISLSRKEEDSKETCYSSLSNDSSLEPQSIRQFIFPLAPPIDENKAKVWAQIFHFGNLAISWTTSMGDRGKMMLETIQRTNSTNYDKLLSVEQMPKRVKINELFSGLFRIQNCLDRPVDVHMNFDQSRQPSITHCSINGQRFQTLFPNESFLFFLDFLPFVSGLQQISGIRVFDLQQKKTYEFDDIFQVFVYQ